MRSGASARQQLLGAAARAQLREELQLPAGTATGSGARRRAGFGPDRAAETESWAAPGRAAAAMELLEPPWPPGLSPLKAVDDLLRCGICFDYFSIAVIIPQCSHNYCSLCIRKFLSYKTQCPTCCVAVSESDLKNNRALDELVKSFSSARQQLVQLVLDTPLISSPLACSRRSIGKSHAKTPPSLPVVKEEVPVIDSFLKKENVCTLTKTDGLAGADWKVCKTEEHHNSSSSSPEAGSRDNKAGSRESPEGTNSGEKPSTSVVKVVNKVDCPVCGVAIPEEYINKHLDSCLSREEKKDCLRSSAHKRKPMPKVVYNLLSDRDLKKKLKEHGLSSRGSRQQLIKRHQEFVHVYNAQCDSLNPKSVAEIVKELEKNEKIRVQLELSKSGENSLTFTKDQTEQEIDEIHTSYRNKHRSEFQFLVDQVKNRWEKSGKRRTESMRKKKEGAVIGLPAGTGEDLEEHCSAAVLGEAQVLKPGSPDGKRSDPQSSEEGQGSVSLVLSGSSGSSSSSSSDILGDLEAEVFSVSSDRIVSCWLQQGRALLWQA
ncbi:E3 ubiquitin-protein ligase RAD18 isoform X2 [Excalfactoria chinensis]|uniref:E3 ubiquitin-protein ligase RAD18 isoform X2 n=1 Tax=Excalfactoria chinensis TaxID=46218 RepID=UPI003B3AB6B7